jgi:DNA polymerase-3 subunit delta'
MKEAIAETLPASPRETADLLGHEDSERAFLDAWTSGRMAHSWLITGPRGIGKATLAFRIARFVLSSGNGGESALFGDSLPASLAISRGHPIFRRIASGGHADLKVLERVPDAEKGGKMPSDIPVELARTAGNFLSMTAGEGGWRVVIVDSLDELNRHGANALLKVIEEPPANALILLVSHSPGTVLATIRSRCRVLALKPLAEPVIIELLGRHLPDMPAAERLDSARLAPGSVGDALALAQSGGIGLYRSMIALLDSLPRLNIDALHTFADKAGKSEESFRVVARLLSGWLGNAITESARRGNHALVRAAELDRWIELWEKTSQSFERTEAINLDRRQTLLNVFVAVETLCRS